MHLGVTKESVTTLEKLLLDITGLPGLDSTFKDRTISGRFANWADADEKREKILAAGERIIQR